MVSIARKQIQKSLAKIRGIVQNGKIVFVSKSIINVLSIYVFFIFQFRHIIYVYIYLILIRFEIKKTIC